MNRCSAYLLITALCLGLFGCSSLITKPVSDADRDTSGAFDGQWTVNIKPIKGIQQVGRAYFKCEFREGVFRFRVNDGVARSEFAGKPISTNVGSDGKFRFEIASDKSYKDSLTAEVSAASQITYIYQGNLSEKSLKGQFIVGKKSENNQGCATRVTIKRL